MKKRILLSIILLAACIAEQQTQSETAALPDELATVANPLLTDMHELRKFLVAYDDEDEDEDIFEHDREDEDDSDNDVA